MVRLVLLLVKMDRRLLLNLTLPLVKRQLLLLGLQQIRLRLMMIMLRLRKIRLAQTTRFLMSILVGLEPRQQKMQMLLKKPVQLRKFSELHLMPLLQILFTAQRKRLLKHLLQLKQQKLRLIVKQMQASLILLSLLQRLLLMISKALLRPILLISVRMQPLFLS